MKEMLSSLPGLHHIDRALKSQTSLSLVTVSAASLVQGSSPPCSPPGRDGSHRAPRGGWLAGLEPRAVLGSSSTYGNSRLSFHLIKAPRSYWAHVLQEIKVCF